MKTAKLTLNGEEYEFPVLEGTENELGIDFTKLRAKTGAISLDPGYGNTGSCTSTVTFIDGEKGILRYRGYPIEEIAKSASFEEVMFLLIIGSPWAVSMALLALSGCCSAGRAPCLSI